MKPEMKLNTHTLSSITATQF